MHRGILTSVGALSTLFLGLGTTHLQATVLYSQPTNGFGGYYSQNDTSGGGAGNYATVYDNFTLGATATIGSVSWIGSYNAVSPGTMTGVTISIWADNAGAPDYTNPPLYTTGDVAGNQGETFLGTDFFSDPTYSYIAPIGFTAIGGTQYWISIVPDVAFPPGWEWESGTGGDGTSYQFIGGSLNPILVDEAFTLNSTTPEPASAVLVGCGLAMLALASRRFKSPSA